MDTLQKDLRYAARSLCNSLGFTVAMDLSAVGEIHRPATQN